MYTNSKSSAGSPDTQVPHAPQGGPEGGNWRRGDLTAGKRGQCAVTVVTNEETLS